MWRGPRSAGGASWLWLVAAAMVSAQVSGDTPAPSRHRSNEGQPDPLSPTATCRDGVSDVGSRLTQNRCCCSDVDQFQFSNTHYGGYCEFRSESPTALPTTTVPTESPTAAPSTPSPTPSPTAVPTAVTPRLCIGFDQLAANFAAGTEPYDGTMTLASNCFALYPPARRMLRSRSGTPPRHQPRCRPRPPPRPAPRPAPPPCLPP